MSLKETKSYRDTPYCRSRQIKRKLIQAGAAVRQKPDYKKDKLPIRKKAASKFSFETAFIH